MAEGSRRYLSIVAETAWGTTPATPTMKTIRNTGGGGIKVDKTQLQSQEMRSDRAVADVTFGQQRASLDIPFELSRASFDDLLEAALFGTWATNVLKQGTVRKSFTIEEGFSDITQYQKMVGAMVNSFALNVAPNAIITGSFGLIGKSAGALSGTSLGAPAAANTTPVMDSFTGSMKEGGVAIAIVTALNLSLANGLEAFFALFQAEASQMGAGRANLSGSLSAYFPDATLANKAHNGEATSLEFTLNDSTGKGYTFLIPKVKLAPGTKQISENQIIQSYNWQAFFDATEATCLKITRTV